ncbi:MAG TPA: J domain-containing protein [Thermoanaerobaculales bacterium]|nr:J domain-containing protein [Thermoanaerobaculales bacterium]HQL30130.1 J domain-containing protein [Thermoanaerobaculales bacterium]
MSRPYLNLSHFELRQMAKGHWNNPARLGEIFDELCRRRSEKAVQLRVEVQRRIRDLTGEPVDFEEPPSRKDLTFTCPCGQSIRLRNPIEIGTVQCPKCLRRFLIKVGRSGKVDVEPIAKEPPIRNDETITCTCGMKLRLRYPIKTGTVQCPNCPCRFRVKVGRSGNVIVEPIAPGGTGPSRQSDGSRRQRGGTSRPSDDPYDILGVGRDTSYEEARAAYRKRIQEYHPDRVAALGTKLRETAEEETKRINWAFECIKRAFASEEGA